MEVVRRMLRMKLALRRLPITPMHRWLNLLFHCRARMAGRGLEQTAQKLPRRCQRGLRLDLPVQSPMEMRTRYMPLGRAAGLRGVCTTLCAVALADRGGSVAPTPRSHSTVDAHAIFQSAPRRRGSTALPGTEAETVAGLGVAIETIRAAGGSRSWRHCGAEDWTGTRRGVQGVVQR